MLTFRDKVRIPLTFVGVISVAIGVGVVFSGMKTSSGVYRFGAWRDMNLLSAIPKEAALWIISGGVAALTASYFTRDK